MHATRMAGHGEGVVRVVRLGTEFDHVALRQAGERGHGVQTTEARADDDGSNL